MMGVIRFFQWLGLSTTVALALVACGGTPPALPEAEGRLERKDLEGAERAFRDATRQYLTESERERVRDGLRRVAELRAEPRLVAAQATPGFAGLVALAEARKALHQSGAGRDEAGAPSAADVRLVAALAARVEALWPAVTAEAKAQRYGGALGEAERLLAPLGRELPEVLSNKYKALQVEAEAFHRERLAASKRADGGEAPGAQALHAGLVRRFGGEAPSPIDNLRAAARVHLSVSPGASGACAEAARDVAKVGTSGQRSASVQVTMQTCTATTQVSERSVPYTWTEKVPYQDTERVQTGTRQTVITRKTCSRKSVAFYEAGKQKVETTVNYDCSVYGSEPVYGTRVVTKYRDEQRQGVRLERTERSTLNYEGVAKVTWPDGSANVPLSAQSNATDTAWTSPQGSKGIDPAKSLAGLKKEAVRNLHAKLVAGATQAVNARFAAKAEAEATAALAAGDVFAAEDADVRAIVALDAVSPATVARIGARYGLDGPGLKAALNGKAPTPPTAELALNASDKLKLGNASKADEYNGDGILERGFNIGRIEYGARGFASVDLPGQPDRAGLGVLMRLSYPALGQMFDGDTFDARGWVIFDTLMFDLWLGGRTSDPWLYADGEEEGAFVGGGGAGYQLMVGYRGGSVGLFAGLRTQRFARAAGGFRTAGASHPIVARLELPVFNRNPIFVEAYGYKALGDNEVRGLDLLFTLSGVHGLTLRYEQTDMEARYNGNSDKDVIDLNRQTTRTLDVAYVFQF